MPNVGDKAPDFTLPANDGKTYALSQFKGKNHVVLVFYPGDDTPTCTKQLCDYRDGWGRFQQFEAVILGINTNDMKSHQGFAERFDFPFPLLEDKNLEVCKAYDALMLSGLLKIAKRAIFIVDKDGTIRFKHVEALPFFKRSKEELFEELKKIAS
ncbi:MAG: peroxiredoxin [Blastocatellia bacterium]|nr:peroxiredoxin [Blastocatellia bacterium]